MSARNKLSFGIVRNNQEFARELLHISQKFNDVLVKMGVVSEENLQKPFTLFYPRFFSLAYFSTINEIQTMVGIKVLRWICIKALRKGGIEIEETRHYFDGPAHLGTDDNFGVFIDQFEEDPLPTDPKDFQKRPIEIEGLIVKKLVSKERDALSSMEATSTTSSRTHDEDKLDTNSRCYQLCCVRFGLFIATSIFCMEFKRDPSQVASSFCADVKRKVEKLLNSISQTEIPIGTKDEKQEGPEIPRPVFGDSEIEKFIEMFDEERVELDYLEKMASGNTARVVHWECLCPVNLENWLEQIYINGGKL
ncbi:hypothetical protein H4219_002861 [Mycoemilia scoparia]|uniref:Uncharacterized protein n=1 Tax=Mycoemilia scoparia TaxID=417184 RepID=A0A9W8DQ17_9FUNG|nr:hypothetical protein H4219_002861 [Mycoemilia scoparia]